MQDTIIKVGVTRQDDYGNLWVTPTDGGQEVKIGEKRSALFPLFQQGNTVSLHWETFKNKPYVKDVKQIVGEPAQPAKLPIQLPVSLPPQREPFISDPTRNASIEAQTAYGRIMDNWEKEIPDSMRFAAVRWGLSKLGIKELPASMGAMDWGKAPKKAQDKGTPAPAQQEAALPIVDGLTGRPEGMPADITTGAKLAAYAGKHGVDTGLFIATVQGSPNDLKTEAQLIAAWNVLAPKMKGK